MNLIHLDYYAILLHEIDPIQCILISRNFVVAPNILLNLNNPLHNQEHLWIILLPPNFYDDICCLRKFLSNTLHEITLQFGSNFPRQHIIY